MSEFDENEVTEEEKLQIAQHYLLSSPPGQFHEVLTDVRKLVSTDLLTDSLVSGIARVSNLKNCKVVITPSGGKALICQAAERDNTHYMDPCNGTVFLVNHQSLVTSLDSSFAEENRNDFQIALQHSLKTYVDSTYQSDLSAGGVYCKDGIFTIVVTGEKNNLKNFWSGKWNSNWTVKMGGASATVSGEIKLHVHYFEDGNLQLQSTKSILPTDIFFDSEGDAVDLLTKLIRSEETSLQTGLEDMYSNMNNETFRSMRRIMPITRTKMEWNVNAVRMVRQVRK